MTPLPKLAALTLVLCATNCSPTPPELEARDGWARETGGSTMGAAYLTVANRGGTDDRLVSVRSERGKASLHNSETANGVVRMRPVRAGEGLTIPAGGELRLSPGGAHVMLTELKAPLGQGEQFGLTLRFQHSRPQNIRITVRAATADSHDVHGAAQ